ncbi:MAG: extracellular solute-binding protein [Actinobacteria bacterium]|nr:extracellular solute-binding protein [Actinomycetota bacterium]
MEKLIKNFNYIFIAAILILTVAVFTASCRLFEPGEVTGDEPLKTEEEILYEDDYSESGELITGITLWDCLEAKERLALMDSNESFMMDNRGINVETRHFRSQEEMMDQFEAASLAGSGPQLLLANFNGVERLAPEKVVKEIIDEVDYALILDGLAEISGYENKNYIIPFRCSGFLVFLYNRDIMDGAPGSMEEVIQYCMEKENFGEGQYGFLFNISHADWIIPFIGGYGGWIIDYATNSLTLDSPATEKTLEFIDHTFNQEKIFTAGIEYGDINSLFKSGDVHMIIDDLVSLQEYREAGVNIGAGKIPRVWQGSRYPTPLISGIGFMINVNTYGTQLDASKSFIDYMLSEKIQLEWNSRTDTLPALKDMDQGGAMKNDPLIYDAFQQAKTCRGMPCDSLMTAIRNSINENVKSLLAGDIVPAEAVLKIQEDAIRLRAGAASTGEETQAEENGEAESSIEAEGDN